MIFDEATAKASSEMNLQYQYLMYSDEELLNFPVDMIIGENFPLRKLLAGARISMTFLVRYDDMNDDALKVPIKLLDYANTSTKNIIQFDPDGNCNDGRRIYECGITLMSSLSVSTKHSSSGQAILATFVRKFELYNQAKFDDSCSVSVLRMEPHHYEKMVLKKHRDARRNKSFDDHVVMYGNWQCFMAATAFDQYKELKFFFVNGLETFIVSLE
ncbi:hypothetical protein Tco_1336156 [Tanacetum coccineum]